MPNLLFAFNQKKIKERKRRKKTLKKRLFSFLDDPSMTHPQRFHSLNCLSCFPLYTSLLNRWVCHQITTKLTIHKRREKNRSVLRHNPKNEPKMNMNMNRLQQQVISFPPVKKSPVGYLLDPAAVNKFRVSTSSKKSEQSKGNSVLRRISMQEGKKTDGFTNGARDQSKLGPKLTETVKRKLALGARILQVGGLEKIFKRLFRVGDGEKLFKAYQCYLSTTAGPIAGLLFISSKKIAFCSERSIKIASPQGDIVRVHYKVSIPLSKIKRVDQSQNTKKPSQKYLEVVTVDDFDFWFMGFLSYKKAFNCLQLALSQSFQEDNAQ
ncbi:PREDICTED: GEM-like protein 4 [Tarenaya hassleriana]|uniref:GEM-like protein 4 n=1 Tax=Tarenaya hassleriana TaxID=28532 RepID=UPI0008FD64B7|nr:PREDICTED: GEM-like protein 4 [Tarenaya hassleriana]